VSGDYANLNSSSSSFAQSYFGIRWRLFDFGRIDSEVRVAKGKQKEALLAYRSAVLRATSEVETGFSQLAAARRQLQHIEAQLENTRLVAQSVNSSYQVGASSEDDALAAKRASAKLEFDVVSARRDVARAIIASSRALGGPIARP
jgi:outer membrane protein TolC